MQRCCGVPLRACVVGHCPSLPRPTSRFRLPLFSSLSFPSSSSSSSYGDDRVALALPITPLKRVISLPPKPHPYIALLSLLFVLSMAFGALLSLALLSIPTIKAFRNLAASMEQLSKVVSQEVPGTLTSLRLSGLEINQLTQQLATLRQKISSSPLSKKHRSSKSSSFSNKDELP
ncbi:uncharacterized protein LOC112092046 [Morus notabilis]|uniref:uncharacterized protein LOC112092046 n=1 Tax=Morus notabilis TaxID=981085 RepID=UPI000CED0C83|nr:uncharacterized protein LOC112092046 [Morus notabilis]